VAVPVAAAVAPWSSYASLWSDPQPIGTTFRWKLDDDNRRTAIVIKDGILEVKMVSNGVTFAFRNHFTDLPEWLASLHTGGSVTRSPNAYC
jgi:hypothetical protein